jgi:two-component sensor histidine kinase
MEGLQTMLEPTTAQAIAVVLHELATNASKYGALSNAEGQIRLTWLRSEDGQVVLRWTELGGPRVNAPERKGFGSRLIEGTISQLGGEALLEWRTEGLVCEVTVPT